MALTRLRWTSCVLAALVAIPSQSFAFDTPLSDTAIREAYFMGQRHDEAMGKFLDKYVKHLSAPKSGPYISSVAIFTPYAQVVLETNQRIGNYSAQQAQADHRNRKETILCIVEVQLTETYPAFIPDPARASSSSPISFVARPYDFWTDLQFHFLDGDNELRPFTSSGHPNYLCGDNGGCTLTGATLQFEFYAGSFPTNEVSVQIDPPEGDQLVLDFDLASVR
ncbi:MAG TPA: hypothetical protein VMJ35_15890 [Dongiaceae bacterium]|nr:hypothetical protein [Dongiaceae bacterium]